MRVDEIAFKDFEFSRSYCCDLCDKNDPTLLSASKEIKADVEN